MHPLWSSGLGAHMQKGQEIPRMNQRAPKFLLHGHVVEGWLAELCTG